MFADLDRLAATITVEQQQQLATATSEVRQNYGWIMEAMQYSEVRVRQMLGELAEFSRSIPMQVRFEPTDLRECIEAAAGMAQKDADHKGVAIDLTGIRDVGPVDLDHSFRYVLKALIKTSLAATPAGGTLAVRARVIGTDGTDGQAALEIETGELKDERSESPSHQLDGAESVTGSVNHWDETVVAMIVQAHHGTIHQQTASAFAIIRIPARQPADKS